MLPKSHRILESAYLLTEKIERGKGDETICQPLLSAIAVLCNGFKNWRPLMKPKKRSK